MTESLTSLADNLRDSMEGSPGMQELQEPQNPLHTISVPAVKTGLKTAPAAETGIASTVESHPEGKDVIENQDASRTTAETHAAPAPQRLVEARPARAPAVLIIEDTTELAEVIQATLERMNLVTAHETHGARAVARFNELQPEVVLLDIGLPDMNGWRFLETIKETHHDRMPIIIIITAYGDPANRLVGKLQGVHDYLIKPFTADEVEKVVARALNSAST